MVCVDSHCRPQCGQVPMWHGLGLAHAQTTQGKRPHRDSPNVSPCGNPGRWARVPVLHTGNLNKPLDVMAHVGFCSEKVLNILNADFNLRTLSSFYNLCSSQAEMNGQHVTTTHALGPWGVQALGWGGGRKWWGPRGQPAARLPWPCRDRPAVTPGDAWQCLEPFPGGEGSHWWAAGGAQGH